MNVMEFKKWILNEVQWLSLPQIENINGISTDAIDFRFEDWAKVLKEKGVALPNIADYMWNSFSAKLPSGGYLNYFSPERVEGKMIVNPKKIPLVTPKAAHTITLPDFWHEFAVFYQGGKVVKTPTLARATD